MSEDATYIGGLITLIIILAVENVVMGLLFPAFSAAMQSLGDTVREIGIGWMEPIIDRIPILVWVVLNVGTIVLLINQIKKGMEWG